MEQDTSPAARLGKIQLQQQLCRGSGGRLHVCLSLQTLSGGAVKPNPPSSPRGCHAGCSGTVAGRSGTVAGLQPFSGLS